MKVGNAQLREFVDNTEAFLFSVEKARNFKEIDGELLNELKEEIRAIRRAMRESYGEAT